ncbi:CaiB/BaiF CoA transferase family protein [Salinigranum salinum]|uniref:CaiB/BaiF CoA transferase family protein n=1 Tax=Salinigranum salinum TaxID=1364937 RepID=UPI001865344A|nr:CoA transferase [Salinigranum salinum]
MPAALDDITVVSFGQIAQGPVATQMLADLGAEVLKIERPGGEWMRHFSMANGYRDGESLQFQVFNRNKRSVELDIKDDDHRAVLYDLCEEADVVLENFRPGVMDRLGFGYEELSERNPGLIYASASGFGSSGPYVDRPGQDLIIQGMGGLMSITGDRDDLPTPQGVAIADLHSATYLAFGILAALHYRDRTGEGQRIEGDLLSATVDLQLQELSTYANTGAELDRGEHGLGNLYHPAPYGVYETADGHIVLSLVLPSELGEILGIDEITDVSTWEEAYERRDEIMAHVADVLETDTTDAWMEQLIEHDVWCGPVKDLPEVLEDPQVRDNDMIKTIDHPTLGELTVTGMPLRLSETPPSIRRHPPRAGEHTAEVLEELGYPADLASSSVDD